MLSKEDVKKLEDIRFVLTKMQERTNDEKQDYAFSKILYWIDRIKVDYL